MCLGAFYMLQNLNKYWNRTKRKIDWSDLLEELEIEWSGLWELKNHSIGNHRKESLV